MPTVKKFRKKKSTSFQKPDHFYSGRPWRRVRLLKLIEEPRCEVCLKLNQISHAVIGDHRLSKRFWPSLALELSNLISMCELCHNVKRSIESSITTREQYQNIFGQKGEGVINVVCLSRTTN